jgi:sporadic carbohydrate cluster protein (TIGR04323 family)
VLSKDLCAATHSREFTELVRDFVRDELAPRTGLVPPLGIQRYLNVRIMLPDRPQGVFPFHTGLLYGHGEASRSLWMPLTDVRDASMSSASLQIVGLDESRVLAESAREARLGIDEMAERFGAASWPVSAGPGDVLLFTQENIHGNVVNVTGRTRVSIDFRVAEARFGDRLARKIAGGYFGLLDTAGNSPRAARPTGRQNVLYLNNNTRSTEGVPVHLQRLMVLDYCRAHGIDYHFEYFELERMDHLPTLAHAVANLECDIVLYSIYALPEGPAARTAILDSALERGLCLHFVNEDVVVADRQDREHLEGILAFARWGQSET